MAGEILQNAQERTLDHKRGHDPQRALHVEAAVARQNVLVVAKLHRQDFLADIFQVDGGVLELQDFYSDNHIVILATRFVHLCKCSLFAHPKTKQHIRIVQKTAQRESRKANSVASLLIINEDN